MSRYDDDLPRQKIPLTMEPDGKRCATIFGIVIDIVWPNVFLLVLSPIIVAFFLSIIPFAITRMLAAFLYGGAVAMGVLNVAEFVARVMELYGSVNPARWLDRHNAYGVVHVGQPLEELSALCSDICTGRWRRDDNYVYFEDPNDAVAYRLTRPW